jgi:hypothetical protein
MAIFGDDTFFFFLGFVKKMDVDDDSSFTIRKEKFSHSQNSLFCWKICWPVKAAFPDHFFADHWCNY